MMEEIEEKYTDPILNITLDTLKKKKQQLVFVNTKRSAEAVAEKISTKIKEQNELWEELSKEILSVVSSPTKQCRRLSKIIKKGIAFHHSGLHNKQRHLIETEFKKGNILVICATPTLAIGVDTPAYRVIIRDTKRYGGITGMQDIPVLEYEQQAGRAGRPKYDNCGEAIIPVSSISEKEKVWHKYIKGKPEEILSKLAVEPILRTYTLSLIATDIVRNKNELFDFMKETFYAHQYGSIEKIQEIILRILKDLVKWEMIEDTITINTTDIKKIKIEDIGFSDATTYVKIEDKENKERLKATRLGKRVAELYLDPYTANYLVNCLRKTIEKGAKEFSMLQMISNTLEMRPLITAKQKEQEQIEEKIILEESNLLSPEPSVFSMDYQDFLHSIKTAIIFEEWINEKTEENILEEYGVTPGELNAKIDRADWLLYASLEINKISGRKEINNEIHKLRIRLQNGVKEELLNLLRLKGIGRVRARKLYKNKIRTTTEIKNTPKSYLELILGKKITKDILEQITGKKIQDEKE